MFSYYGSKANVVHLYPKPKHDLIIDRFAGSARYPLLHWQKDVVLIDKYEVIIKIWKYLQRATPKEIINLPRPKGGEDLRDYHFDSEEAQLFMGFVVSYGAFSPANIVSVSKAHSRGNFINYTLNRVANNLHKIRHWHIVQGDYTLYANEIAIHFIDPPYQHGGHKYKCSNKHINFPDLKIFCEQLKGQTIVCENTKADWMEFKPMAAQRGSFKTTTEAIWCNEATAYDNKQILLF